MQLSQQVLLSAFGLLALASLELQACLPAIVAPISAGVLGIFSAGKHQGAQSLKSEKLPENPFKGCYADSITRRALGNPVLQDPGMVRITCTDLCKNAKMTFIGLQNGTECYCASKEEDYTKYGAISNLKCNVPCGGDSKQMCGGYMAYSIYEA